MVLSFTFDKLPMHCVFSEIRKNFGENSIIVRFVNGESNVM